MPPKKKADDHAASAEPIETGPPEEEEEGPGRVAIKFSLREVANLPCDLETIVCFKGFCQERRSNAAPSSSAPSGWELPKASVIREVSQKLYDDLVSRKLEITLRDAERDFAVIGEASVSLLPLLHGQTEVGGNLQVKLTDAYYNKWFPEAEPVEDPKAKGKKSAKDKEKEAPKPPPEEPEQEAAAKPPPPATTIGVSISVAELIGPVEDRDCWTTVTLSVSGIFGLPDRITMLGLGDVLPHPVATQEESPYIADHLMRYHCTMLGESLGEGQLAKPLSVKPAAAEGVAAGEETGAATLSDQERQHQQEQYGLSVRFKEAAVGVIKYRGATFVREFRRMLNSTGGIWFYFMPEEKVSTDPKKPNPPECPTIAKHFTGKAWFDLRALIQPGVRTASARCSLVGDSMPDMAEEETLQSSCTFVRLALELSHDLTPPPGASSRLTLPQIVPKRNDIQTFPSSAGAASAYNVAVQRCFAGICRECGPDGAGGGLPKGSGVAAAVELMQKSGVYEDLKEDLRASVIRVFRERLRKDTSAIPGACIDAELREKLLSGTYTHLKTVMFQVLDEVRENEPALLPEVEGREKAACVEVASNDGGGDQRQREPMSEDVQSNDGRGGAEGGSLVQALQKIGGPSPRRASYGKAASPSGTPTQDRKRSSSKLDSGTGTPTQKTTPVKTNPVLIALKESEEARNAKEALAVTAITGERCERLAYEAEMIGNWTRAAEFNQSKLVLQEFHNEPQAWIAYAKFCSRSRCRQDAAEEALRQAITLFQDGVPHSAETAMEADLMLASLLLDRGRHDVAIRVFRSWHEKDFAEPFTRFLLGLALFLSGSTAEAEHLLESAGQTYQWLQGLPDKNSVADKLSAFRGQDEASTTSQYVICLERLLEFGLPELAFTFIDQSNTLSRAAYASEPIALVDAKASALDRNYQAAVARLEPIVEKPSSKETWRLLGECYFQLQDFDRALQALQTAMSFERKFEDPAVYIRLGSVLLVKKRWKQARDAFLRSIQYKSTAEAWSGVAYAELRSEECQMCYEALCEANLLDNDRPDVWAQFTLVHLRLENWVAADKACEHCLAIAKLDESAADAACDLLLEVATEYLRREREPVIAEAAARRSLQSRDTWQGHNVLADLLARQQLLEKAVLESQVAIQMLREQPELRKPIYEKALHHCEALGDPALLESLHAVQKMADEALGGGAPQTGP